MGNLKDVIYLSAEDYNTLYTNGTITINGITLTYDANNVYIVPDNTQEQIDDILAKIPSNASSSNKMLTADDISEWAKASTKPSYNFSEIGSKPTTIGGYGITDAKIESGTITLGSNTITPLTSFTETDPTVPSWAKQSTKPSYDYSEIGNTPSLATVATTGDYNDLDNKPTIPSGVVVDQTYNASSSNAQSGVAIAGAGFLTSHQDITGKADKASITAGTAGTSSATSGSTLSVPYVTMNSQGIVTGYGTHTHTVSGFLTSQDHYKSTVTAGTAGTSSATSGSTLAVPYVTVNANGHVTGYGTHTHTVTGFLTSHQSLTRTNSTLTYTAAGSTQTVSIPLLYLGTTRVPSVYYISNSTYGLGTSFTLTNATRGDVIVFTEYGSKICVLVHDGSNFKRIILSTTTI